MKKTNLQQLIELLDRQGLRLSVSRRAVIEVLLKSKKPLSAAEIISSEIVRKKKINRATVYRSLSFLEEKGVLELLRLNGDERLYHLNLEHHHHLVCTVCQKIEAVHFCNQLDSQEKQIEKSTGFKVQRHVLEFYGLCRDCAAKNRV